MQSKTMHEPFVRVVKRGEMPMKKKVFVRLAAVVARLGGGCAVHLLRDRAEPD